jgi:hypothetical protein
MLTQLMGEHAGFSGKELGTLHISLEGITVSIINL